jgi:F-type H+-transporting ATPase subunit a
MADPVLHIKDSYYFEVPKLLYPYAYSTRQQFPDVWISLDPQFQDWEAERLYKELAVLNAGLPPKEKTIGDWHHWVHADHKNFAKPLKEFLEENYQAHKVKYDAWKTAQQRAAQGKDTAEKAPQLDFNNYSEHVAARHTSDHDYLPFLKWRHEHAEQFRTVSLAARDKDAIREWKEDSSVPEWSEVTVNGKPKLQAYNEQLSGKILIPQPFATLRNLYEKESGFAISKYLLIEIFVGLVLVLLFSRLASKIERGKPAKGIFSNLLEVFLVFIRDQIAKPVLGSHDHGHDHDHAHAEGHAHGASQHGHGEHAHGEPRHGDHRHSAVAHAAKHKATDPADRFLPLLWTIFFFVLGCNLMGMLPWAGAPTAAFAVTAAMAAVTFVTVLVAGMLQFGVLGFFLNQIPGMDLPWYMAIIIKPMILLIELLGLCIKHGVLAVRLLANMVAGHLVILGIMGLAFGAEAALRFSGAPGWQWGVTAIIAVVAAAAFNVLELFVAFLQAYIITFLSALFIGAAIHKH